MPRYHVHAQGDAYLSLDEIYRIGEKKGGSLIAVDSIDIILSDMKEIQLPPKKQGELRDYFFMVEADDLSHAQGKAQLILNTVLQERDTPVYQELLTLLDDTTLDHTQLQARYIQEGYGDSEDLVITRPGLGNTPRKIYYRGSISYACLELLARFTKVTVIDE